MFFNESHLYHFAGAFTAASFARLCFGNWTAYAIVMAAGIMLEFVQYAQWRGAKDYTTGYYWSDTCIDLIMNAAGAAIAIFPGWWH